MHGRNTLVSGIMTHSQIMVNGLREYEPPPPVVTYQAKRNNEGIIMRDKRGNPIINGKT